MLPSGRVRLRRRAWGRSIRASNPRTSGSSTKAASGRGDPTGPAAGGLGGRPRGPRVDVAGIALVEDEVEHTHHRAHVAGTIDTGPTDRALGAADALRHGGFGDEVGLRDLACGE